MKVLIIEDEITILNSIKSYLQMDGFHCEAAMTLNEALDKTALYKYDCVLVDITLPGGSGLEVIKAIKDTSQDTGIIVVSAKNAVEDKVEGLSLGADDYLTKPFHLSELIARIKALIRRKQFNGKPMICFHEIEVNPEKKLVLVDKLPTDLTKSEYRLLLYFIANQNRVLSRESIAEHLAGDSADMMASHDFIYSHIKNLRRKLVDAGAEDYIKAVYGMGYKFSDH